MIFMRRRSAIETLHEQITVLKRELDDTYKKLKHSDEENVKHKTLLNTVNDKTRKLLTSLNLDNDVKDTSTALDFARNISYIKRRGSTTPVLPSIPTKEMNRSVSVPGNDAVTNNNFTSQSNQIKFQQPGYSNSSLNG